MLFLTSEAMLGRSLIAIKEKIHFNKFGIHVHVGTNAFDKFGHAFLCALIFIRKERLFRQNCLMLQKIVFTKFFEQPLKRFFNPFFLRFIQWQFRSSPKHVWIFSPNIIFFNKRKHPVQILMVSLRMTIASSRRDNWKLAGHNVPGSRPKT